MTTLECLVVKISAVLSSLEEEERRQNLQRQKESEEILNELKKMNETLNLLYECFLVKGI